MGTRLLVETVGAEAAVPVETVAVEMLAEMAAAVVAVEHKLQAQRPERPQPMMLRQLRMMAAMTTPVPLPARPEAVAAL